MDKQLTTEKINNSNLTHLSILKKNHWFSKNELSET